MLIRLAYNQTKRILSSSSHKAYKRIINQMPKNEKCYDINDEFNLSKNELHTNDINLASMQYIQMDITGRYITAGGKEMYGLVCICLQTYIHCKIILWIHINI